MRKLAAAYLKYQWETSALAPKAVPSKVAPKRKSNVKDDRPTKKVTGHPLELIVGISSRILLQLFVIRSTRAL